MSTGNLQQTSRSLPPPSTSVSRTLPSGTISSNPKSQLDNQGLGEDIKNLSALSSNQYNVMLPPCSQAQQGNLPQGILSGSDYSFHVPYSSSRHSNLYLFSSDTAAVTSQSSEEKERDKTAENLVVSSRVFNSASITQQTNVSPKPYVALHIKDSKNDKMISGFDRQVDGLSSLSVIAVSNFHEQGQSSPSLTTSGLAQSQALRYQAGNDAMLSAINYNENDMLQEGGFDVPVTSTFGTLDGLLGTIGGSGVSASSMRLPDLLEGDGSQEPYIDAGQDLQLSPESFTTAAEGFNMDSSLNRISNSATTECTEENRKTPESGSVALSEKLRAKNRPVKATSPSRPGTQPCPTCGKVFSNSSALTKHKLTHSDERKYICQLCTKAFKRQDHLNGHMLTHRNKKPYECDVEGCVKSYCDARSLRRHKENHHSNTCTTGSVNVGSQMNVIPAMAHLGFSSLQSFPASVITSSGDQTFAEGTENCNRIQYAPAVGSSNQSSLTCNDFNQENTSKSLERQIMSSVVPTAASKLQFLALHQHPQQFHLQNKNQTTEASSTRAEKPAILAPWHPQTINTSALLLAQNFGSVTTSQSSVSQPHAGQIDISKVLDTISSIKNRMSPNTSSQQLETQSQSSEHLKKEPPHSHESQKQALHSSDSDSYLSSPAGGTASHSSVEVPASFSHTQLSSDPMDVNASINSTDNAFGQHSISLNSPLLQTEVSGSGDPTIDTSVTTSATSVTESDQSQINSPLLQQLLTPPQRMDALSNSTTEGAVAQRAALLQQALLAGTQQQSLQQQSIFPNWHQVAVSFANANSSNSRFGSDPKPVACTICKRKFKNIPALNGHMRLHGGYFKKENDLKKTDRKQIMLSQQQPSQTASTNVRALIEEKIIRKISTSQANTGGHLSLDTFPLSGNLYTQTDQNNVSKASDVSNEQSLSDSAQHTSLSVSQENTLCNEFPSTSQTSTLYDSISKINNEIIAALDWQKEINELKEQFRVPQPPGEKLRRHSDSDHFIPSKRQCPSYTKSALADLLKKKVAKRTTRTGSDPGEPLLHVESPQMNSTPSTPTAPSSNPPDLTQHMSFSTEHPLSLASNQNLSSIDDSDLPLLLEQELIKSEPDVCLSIPSCVFSSVSQALSTNTCSTPNDNEVDKKEELSSATSDGAHWPTNLTLPFFGNESQSLQTTSSVVPPSSSTISGSASNSVRGKAGEDSNDDDVFLSPVSLPTSPLKIKRKHRPEPLFIPPYVNNCGFTSRLRSPRLWDPSNPENKNASPPPYTPPPMLSPVRSGSGLFWHILSGSGSLTPKSAPITPSFSLFIRRNSTNEIVPEEEEICEAPETDILPHVNIGSHFQARLPPFNPNSHSALKCEDKADIVWDPKVAENLSESDVEMYLDLSCSAVVPGGGKNKEYAMHILHLSGGNIQEAMLRLMDPNPMLPDGHTLLTYKYPETDKWTPEDIESYHQSLIRCDKDFYSISQEMQVKTVKECVQFYYIWKKLCPEEYKRLRLIRRRREQESLIYGSRQQLPSDCEEKTETLRDGLDCDMQFSDINMPSSNGPVPTTEQNSAQTTIESNRTSPTNRAINDSSFLPIVRSCDMSEEFPCKICGKVFSKVKSRSAHMKSHKQTESEKKNKFEC